VNRAPILILSVVLLACGNGSATPSGTRPAEPTVSSTVSPSGADPAPAPDTITPADDGRTFTMRIGDGSSLVIRDPLAPDPVVDGTSVEVIGIDNITASGQREWELRARAPGRTVIRGPDPIRYSITIEVRG
jgi:hypothetical protein